ncbi:MAG: hypothetical protein ACREAC_03605 [Blastocatellia bacterium]
MRKDSQLPAGGHWRGNALFKAQSLAGPVASSRRTMPGARSNECLVARVPHPILEGLEWPPGDWIYYYLIELVT